MQKLDPKAVWLFFINYIWAWFFVFALFGWVIPIMVVQENIYQLGTSLSDDLKLWFLVIVLFLLALSYLFARLSYHFYRYELSDIGFKKEYGIIWKQYVTIPYDRIQNVDIYRGIWARMLGLSDLQIQTAGASGAIMTEGRLPGLSREVAEHLRDELIRVSRQMRTGQGL